MQAATPPLRISSAIFASQPVKQRDGRHAEGEADEAEGKQDEVCQGRSPGFRFAGKMPAGAIRALFEFTAQCVKPA